jgi:hypothetical protein
VVVSAGGVEMDAKTVGDVTARIAEGGTRLQSIWDGRKGLISEYETSGVGGGNDRLAMAFANSYFPLAQQIRSTADALPGRYQSLATAGQASIQDYLNADRNGAQAMQ